MDPPARAEYTNVDYPDEGIVMSLDYFPSVLIF